MSDLDKIALLPCPFCGGEPAECMDSADDPCRFIRCDACDFDLMGGPVGIGWWPSLKAAGQAWNRRAALLTAPPGWKLVPVEPTHIQLDAAVEGRKRGGLYGAYVAAIAAAPEVK